MGGRKVDSIRELYGGQKLSGFMLIPVCYARACVCVRICVCVCVWVCVCVLAAGSIVYKREKYRQRGRTRLCISTGMLHGRLVADMGATNGRDGSEVPLGHERRRWAHGPVVPRTLCYLRRGEACRKQGRRISERKDERRKEKEIGKERERKREREREREREFDRERWTVSSERPRERKKKIECEENASCAREGAVSAVTLAATGALGPRTRGKEQEEGYQGEPLTLYRLDYTKRSAGRTRDPSLFLFLFLSACPWREATAFGIAKLLFFFFFFFLFLGYCRMHWYCGAEVIALDRDL